MGSLFRNREFVALSATAFARSQAYSTVLIALALYADLFGTTGFVEGLFGTSFALAQLLIVLPLGRAIDTGNAKRFLLGGLAVNVAVFVAFVFVQNPVDVILLRIVQGVGASVLWLTGSAVVGEISPGDSMGRWFGFYNQVGAFSSLAGDVVGGYLLFAYGFTWTYLVLSAITIGAGLLVFVFLRDSPGGQADPAAATGVERLRSLLDRRLIQSLVAFRLAFSIGKMSVIIFLPIYARTAFGVSALGIGGILAGGKLTKALLQGWMGELTDRVGHKPWFVAGGALLYALGTAAIPLASVVQDAVPTVRLSALGHTLVVTGAVLTLFLAYSVLGVADSLRLPASMALFVEEGERFDSVASSMSLRSISWKVGQVVGPALVGVIKDTLSTLLAFWTAAGFVLLATMVFVVVYARENVSETLFTAPGD